MDPIDELLQSLTPDGKSVQPQPAPVKPSSTASTSVELGSSAIPELAAYAAEQTAIAQQQAQEQLKKQRQEEQQQERQALQKQQQLEALKQQRRQELQSQAEQWLKQLDRKSTEGRWFEEFACNHDSKLEAAIEYLSALQEVNQWLGH